MGNFIYGPVCRYLNTLENHQTLPDFENALIWKSFAFRFVNSYNSLFYIAFYERFRGPDDGNSCVTESDPNCIHALQISLSIIFATQILFNNSLELLLPFWRRLQTRRVMPAAQLQDLTLPEQEYFKSPCESTFDDYDELVTTYGYATMFAIVFPLAPALAQVSFLMETRLDAIKYLGLCRRPLPHSVKSIGTWERILLTMGQISVLTNLLMIFFVSDAGKEFFPDDTERWIAFILIEHAALTLKILLDWLIPDQDAATTTFLARQHHLQQILIMDWLEKEKSEVVHLSPEEKELLSQSAIESFQTPQSIALRQCRAYLPSPTEITDRSEGDHFFSGTFIDAYGVHPDTQNFSLKSPVSERIFVAPRNID